MCFVLGSFTNRIASPKKVGQESNCMGDNLILLSSFMIQNLQVSSFASLMDIISGCGGAGLLC